MDEYEHNDAYPALCRQEEIICPWCGDWQMESLFVRKGEIVGCSSCVKRKDLW